MACNGVLTPPVKVLPPQIGTSPPVQNFLIPHQSLNFLLPLQLEMTASAFFTHGCFQETHVHISEDIVAD